MSRSRQLLLAGFALLGAVSQVVQTVQVRELLVAFHGNEACLGLFYGAWLFWIGVGSWVFSRLRPRLAALHVVGAIELFCGGAAFFVPALVAQLTATYVCRGWLPTSPGQVVPFGQWAVMAWILTAPTSLLTGFLFPAGMAALTTGEGERATSVALYVCEAAGSLLAGLALTALLAVQVGHVTLTAALAAAVSIYATVGLAAQRRSRWVVAVPAVAAAAALLMLCTPLHRRAADALEDARWQTLHPHLQRVGSVHTPYRHLSVARLAEQYSLVENGMVTLDFPAPVEAHRTAAVIMTQRPEPSPPRVLFLGSPLDPLCRAILDYPLKSFTGVSADAAAWHYLEAVFPRRFRRLAADPRVTWQVTDGRGYINHLAAAGMTGRFDIVVLALGDPSTAAGNRCYTLEALRALAGAMTPTGVLTLAVTAGSNYLGEAARSYSASIYRTLSRVFADVRVAAGDTHRFFAGVSKGYLTLSPGVLRRRYIALPLARRRFPATGFVSVLDGERIAFLRRQLAGVEAPINRDSRPIAFYLNMRLWAAFSGARGGALLTTTELLGWPIFCVPLIVLLIVRLGYEMAGRAAVATVAGRAETSGVALSVVALGVTSMTVQLLLLYAYQSALGDVYERIGMLNGLAMFGLGAGAAAGRTVLGRADRRIGVSAARRGLIVLLLLTAAAVLALPVVLRGIAALAPVWQHAAFGLVMATMAAFTGAGFPFAMSLLRRGTNRVGTTSAVYEAADHLGGAAGALLTGTLWVPLFGLAATRLIVFATLGAAVLLLLSRPVIDRFMAGRDLRSSRLCVSFPYLRTAFSLIAAALVAWSLTALSAWVRPAATADTVGAGRRAYRVQRDEAGEVRAIIVDSMAVAGDIRGYAGPLDMRLRLERSPGKTLRFGEVRHLSSHETPSYIRHLDAWLRGFRGLPAGRPLVLGRDIDAMSGATVTSAAVVRIANRVAQRARGDVLGESAASTGRAGGWRVAAADKRLWILLATLALFVPVYLSGRANCRRLYLVVTALVLGLWLNIPFTLLDAANLSRGRVPSLAGNPAWYVLAGFILLTSLAWGQVYCGFVCPFGAVQELLWELGGRLGFRRRPSVTMSQRLRFGKYALAAIVLCGFWATGRTQWVTFSPMQSVFRAVCTPAVAAIAGVAAVGAVVFFRFWCRCLCPAGALLALGNKLALARRWAPRRVIERCDLGVRAEFDIDCIQCNRCLFRADAAGGGARFNCRCRTKRGRRRPTACANLPAATG